MLANVQGINMDQCLNTMYSAITQAGNGFMESIQEASQQSNLSPVALIQLQQQQANYNGFIQVQSKIISENTSTIKTMIQNM